MNFSDPRVESNLLQFSTFRSTKLNSGKINHCSQQDKQDTQETNNYDPYKGEVNIQRRIPYIDEKLCPSLNQRTKEAKK